MKQTAVKLKYLISIDKYIKIYALSTKTTKAHSTKWNRQLPQWLVITALSLVLYWGRECNESLQKWVHLTFLANVNWKKKKSYYI